MYSNLKKFRQTGFTLVELLIVVVILAILAAIVIPQFSRSTVDAREAALDSNMAAIRSAMELYRAQHGVYPGVTVSAADTTNLCTGGTGGSGAAKTAQSFADQLLLASDQAGHTCNVGNLATYKYGPYLRKGIPADINGVGGNLAGAAVTGITDPTALGTAIGVTGTGTGLGGWSFDTVSGQLIMNSSALDSGGVVYSKH